MVGFGKTKRETIQAGKLKKKVTAPKTEDLVVNLLNRDDSCLIPLA